ncbi:MAG: copper chaperone PCu(A)C [Allorhizobium sp.]
MTRIYTFAAAALLATVSTGSALAHSSFANGPVQPETTVAAVLQIPHGCDGKATTEVQVKLPEGFISAKPMPKAGWDLEVIKGDYTKSYKNHGEAITGGAVEIRWKNGNLSDDFYDTFTISGKVSDVEGATGLAFVTTQLCGSDAKVVWDEIAAEGTDPHSLKNPAPVLNIAAADTAAGDHMMEHGSMPAGMMPGQMAHGAAMGHDAAMAPPAGMEPVKVGDLDLSAAFVKAMLPGQPVGGGFVTIHNGGSADDRLISAASPSAGRVEMHEMVMQNDVMKMRQLNEGIPVPAGATVELKPGALHLMFMDVKDPFVEGGSVKVTLTFEKAGPVEIVLPVGSARGMGK